MELYQLEYFRSLCYYKSFTQTAKAFDVTQPSITIAVKKLEKELGGELIDTSGKTLIVTPLGEALLQHVNVIHEEILAIRDDALRMTKQQKDPVLIGVPLSLCPELMHAIVNEFMPLHRDIPVLLYQSPVETVATQLNHGLLDIGVIIENERYPALESKLLDTVEFYAFFSEDSPLCGREVITPHMLEDKPLIMAESPVGVMALVQEYLNRNGACAHSPRLGNFLPSGALPMSQNGAGIAFLSSKEFARSGLHYARLDPPLCFDIYLAYRKNRLQMQHKKELLSFLLDKYRK